MNNSKIEWTDHTFNPWIGCTKVSDGCKFCYADLMASRFGHAVWGPKGTRKTPSANYWKQPLKWNKEAVKAGTRIRVFCASMGDVFEDATTMPASEWSKVVDARKGLFDLIDSTPELDWLILTKRPENIVKLWPGGFRSNVWLGTSIEDRRVLDREAELSQARHLCPVHFLSVEPLIGPVTLDLALIDWVIVGGESGHSARPFDPVWADAVLNQCTTANVPFFMKQLGQHGNKAYKDFTKFPTQLQLRQFP